MAQIPQATFLASVDAIAEEAPILAATQKIFSGGGLTLPDFLLCWGQIEKDQAR